jgi:hypothetical protein
MRLSGKTSACIKETPRKVLAFLSECLGGSALSLEQMGLFDKNISFVEMVTSLYHYPSVDKFGNLSISMGA